MTIIIKEYTGIASLTDAFFEGYGRLPGDVNRDEKISDNAAAQDIFPTIYENLYFWKELLENNSSLGDLSYTPDDAGGTAIKIGTTIPASKYSKSLGWNYSYRENLKNNTLTLSSYQQNGDLIQVIPTDVVQYIDKKIDDGRPLSGVVFATLNGEISNCSSGNNEYNKADGKCFLGFWKNPLIEANALTIEISTKNQLAGYRPDSDSAEGGGIEDSPEDGGAGSSVLPCALNANALLPSKNLKVKWFLNTDIKKSSPLADGAQINAGAAVVAEVQGCKDNILYTNMDDFNDDGKDEHIYVMDNAKTDNYVFRCKSGSFAAEGTPGNRRCYDYIPAHILYAATGSNDGFVTNTVANRNNGGVNDCVIDWGDGKTSPCANGNNPHAYSSAGNYHIRVYGEKFTGFCSFDNVSYCGNDFFSFNSKYKSKLKKLYSLGKWDNMITATYSFYTSGLNEVSKNALKYLTSPNAKDFNGIFQNTSLTYIPSGLFKYNIYAETFQFIFGYITTITSIPENLFEKNTRATSFHAAFIGNTALTSIPDNLFKTNGAVTTFGYVFNNSKKLQCSDIAAAAARGKWPRWNAGGVTMTGSILGTKKGSLEGGETSAAGVCAPLICIINTASLIPADKNLKVVWYKSTDTGKTTPLADGSQINDGDIITADATGCADNLNVLYVNMSDFDDDNKNEKIYALDSAKTGNYSFKCSGDAMTVEGTAGNRQCKDYIPAHILYSATKSSDGIFINNIASGVNNNGGVNDCAIDWGDGKTSVCLKGNNPHTYASAGDYHIRIYGEKFTGLCLSSNEGVCGSGAGAAANYRIKIKKAYSLGKWDNILSLYYSFYKTSLDAVSKNTFKHLKNAKIFDYAFYYCASLTSIPGDLFKHNAPAESFNYVFSYCTTLASLPSGLFVNNKATKEFKYFCYHCENLISISDDLFKYNDKVTNFSYAFRQAKKLQCSDLAAAAARGQWPRWNAADVTMSEAVALTKRGSVEGGETSTTGVCAPPTCVINTASLVPSDRNLKVVWYKSTDTNKTTPLTNGSQINDGDIITADAGCKDGLTNILYTNMSDFDNDSKNELMYGAFGAEYSFKCSDGALAAEGTPGTKACNGYIPAHILYAATGTNDGIVIKSSTFDYNNGDVNDCAIDWGDGKTSVCLNGNNPHTYSSAGDYHIRIYGEKFMGFCFNHSNNAELYCGSDYTFNPNYQPKLKKLYSMGKWNNTFKSLQSAFTDAENLNEISKNTFKYLTEVLDFGETFSGCSSLTSIPAGLFDYNTKVKIFYSAFERCANLTSIPDDLFKKNTEVTSFRFVFSNCPKLTSIPTGFFDNNKKVEDFSFAFYGWGIESIPANLFKVHDKVFGFSGTFRDCKNLKEIPPGLFDPANIAELPNHTTKVIIFLQVFSGCSSLTSIPADLFKNHKNVISFDDAFSACSNLTSIPVGLFKENKAVTNFDGAFRGCSKLASIPADLFKENKAVTNFGSVFSNCTKLPCSDITTKSALWPRWNASGVTMTNATYNCKQ
jgi:hypothetical protein